MAGGISDRREISQLARLGNAIAEGADQFAVLLENATDGRAATVAAEAVEVVRAPYPLAGHTIRLSASSGVAALQPPLTASEQLAARLDASEQDRQKINALRSEVDSLKRSLRDAQESIKTERDALTKSADAVREPMGAVKL